MRAMMEPARRAFKSKHIYEVSKHLHLLQCTKFVCVSLSVGIKSVWTRDWLRTNNVFSKYTLWLRVYIVRKQRYTHLKIPRRQPKRFHIARAHICISPGGGGLYGVAWLTSCRHLPSRGFRVRKIYL